MKNKERDKKAMNLVIDGLLKDDLRYKKLADKFEIDKRVDDYKNHISTYKTEVKKALLTAIVAAFSFLIALEWREVIKFYIDDLLVLTSLQSDIISALIVTLIGVLSILIFTKLLGEKEEDKNET